MAPLTEIEYTVTGLFDFAEESCKQDPNLYMASPDVDSLFTNIPLDKAIDICIDSLYNDNQNTPKISKDVFRDLLNVATNESFFIFNNKFYKQIECVAMGFPLGATLRNIFMCSFENNWLKDCALDLKLVFYRQHVDDIFILFSPVDHAENFEKYLSCKNPNIKFSLEKENEL